MTDTPHQSAVTRAIESQRAEAIQRELRKTEAATREILRLVGGGELKAEATERPASAGISTTATPALDELIAQNGGEEVFEPLREEELRQAIESDQRAAVARALLAPSAPAMNVRAAFRAMLEEDGMEEAYRSNVAMLLHDRWGITDHGKRNRCATEILALICRDDYVNVLMEHDKNPLPEAPSAPAAKSADESKAGIYRKFKVELTDGSSCLGGKHERCHYFVLDWNHDRFAVPAARAYADACASEYPALAEDLRDMADAFGGASAPAADAAMQLERDDEARKRAEWENLFHEAQRKVLRLEEEARAMQRRAEAAEEELSELRPLYSLAKAIAEKDAPTAPQGGLPEVGEMVETLIVPAYKGKLYPITAINEYIEIGCDCCIHATGDEGNERCRFLLKDEGKTWRRVPQPQAQGSEKT